MSNMISAISLECGLEWFLALVALVSIVGAIYIIARGEPRGPSDD